MDGALKVVTTLLRRLTTPARVARLGLRRGDSGGGWSVLVVLEALGVFGAFDDLEGRRGSTKFILFVILTIQIAHCYVWKGRKTARRSTDVAR